MYKRRRQTEKIGKDINKQTMRIKMETKQKLRIEIKTETDRQILGIKMEPEIENNPPIKDIEISVNLATLVKEKMIFNQDPQPQDQILYPRPQDPSPQCTSVFKFFWCHKMSRLENVLSLCSVPEKKSIENGCCSETHEK